MVQINVKLAQLYDIKYVNEPENGEKRLVEAVESALGEQQRREREGVRDGEGPWMTDDEIGATLEGGTFEMTMHSPLIESSSWNTLRDIRFALPCHPSLRQSTRAVPAKIMPPRRTQYVLQIISSNRPLTTTQ